MADLIERLTSTVSSDEEVFVIQKLHSVLSTSNSRQSDTALSPTGIEKDGCINLFGMFYFCICVFFHLTLIQWKNSSLFHIITNLCILFAMHFKESMCMNETANK